VSDDTTTSTYHATSHQQPRLPRASSNIDRFLAGMPFEEHFEPPLDTGDAPANTDAISAADSPSRKGMSLGELAHPRSSLLSQALLAQTPATAAVQQLPGSPFVVRSSSDARRLP
jgi:hypothetical protein